MGICFSSMNKILVIEDNKNQLLLLTDRLKSEGYEVVMATNGLQGAELLKKESFDLLLVDVMLPEKNGFDIVAEYRQRGGESPVLFVTAKSEIADKVSGLRIGGDDYITKPYNFSELIARMEAVLRRTKKTVSEKNRMILILPKKKIIALDLLPLFSKKFSFLKTEQKSPFL